MSAVVSTPIVDKNGKQTTVKKKVGEAPKPFARPIPFPISRPQQASPEQRNKDAVRDLLTRLSVGDSSTIADSDVKEVSTSIYSVTSGKTKFVAFDNIQVSDEIVSGIVTIDDGKVGGSLYLGNGTSSQTDSRGYALRSSNAAVETQLDAAKIALPYL
jgi:hypothetical protein